jgi:hypothetical protein
VYATTKLSGSCIGIGSSRSCCKAAALLLLLLLLQMAVKLKLELLQSSAKAL